MIIHKLSLLCAALLLSGCAAIAPRDSAVTVQGELSYRERIMLPPGSTVRVEIRRYTARGSSVVAQRLIDLAGRQVPVAFAMEVDRRAVDPGAVYELRGILSYRGYARRATEPTLLDLASGQVATGTLQLRPLDRMAFGTAYRCGDVPVRLGRLDDAPRLVVDGITFQLRPGPSDSGEMLVAVDYPTTTVRIDGEAVLVHFNGRALAECRMHTAAPMPFAAAGNEPDWRIRLDAGAVMRVAGHAGATREMKLLGRETEGDTTRFRAASETEAALVSATAAICRDAATGMPHPYAVTVQTRNARYSGCGGEPLSFLVGREWRVERLDGRAILDRSQMTLAFNPERRVAGLASCNRYSAEYRLTSEGLTIDPAATTRMACADALMDQENRFLEILRSVERFDLDTSGALVLTGSAGTLLVR